MPKMVHNVNILNLEFGHKNFTLTYEAPLLKEVPPFAWTPLLRIFFQPPLLSQSQNFPAKTIICNNLSQCTYHRCYKTLQIFLTIEITFFENQTFPMFTYIKVFFYQSFYDTKSMQLSVCL